MKNLCVGDVVLCHGHAPTEDKLGFVEEIICEPISRPGFFYEGMYSIYGLQERKDHSVSMDYYFGDYRRSDLEFRNKKMTVDDLMRYSHKFKENRGVMRDIALVIVNLGRKQFRNEGRPDEWGEIQN